MSGALDEINQILRDDFDPPEPATCLEEIERAGVVLDEPWFDIAVEASYRILDFDLARDMARGK